MLKKKRCTYWAVFPKEVFFEISYSSNQRKIKEKNTMGDLRMDAYTLLI
jgi:hypothetical protein